MSSSPSTSSDGGRPRVAGQAWNSVSGAPFPGWSTGGAAAGSGASPAGSLSGAGSASYTASSPCSGNLPALPDAARLVFLLGAAPSAASAQPPSTPLERFGRAAGGQRRHHLLGLVLSMAGPAGRAPSARLLSALADLDGERPYVEPSASRGAAALARRKGNQAKGGRAWQHLVPAGDVLQALGVRRCRQGLAESEVRGRLRQQRRQAAAVELAASAVASGTASGSSATASLKRRSKGRSSKSDDSVGGGSAAGGSSAGGSAAAGDRAGEMAPSARRLVADAALMRSSVARNLLAARVHRTALVLRGGVQYHVPFEAVVAGDIVYVPAGRRVPSDLRVLAASEDCEALPPPSASSSGGGGSVGPSRSPSASSKQPRRGGSSKGARPVQGGQSEEPKPSRAANMLLAGATVTQGEAFGVALIDGAVVSRRASMPAVSATAAAAAAAADGDKKGALSAAVGKQLRRAAETLLIEHAVVVRRVECLSSWTPAGVLLVALPALHVVRRGALQRALRTLAFGLVILVLDSDVEAPTEADLEMAGLGGLVEVLPRGRHPRKRLDPMMGGGKAALACLSTAQIGRLVRDLTEVTGAGDQRPIYALLRGRIGDAATLRSVHAGAVPLQSSSHVAQDAADALLCSGSLEDIYGFRWLETAVREQQRLTEKQNTKKKCVVM